MYGMIAQHVPRLIASDVHLHTRISEKDFYVQDVTSSAKRRLQDTYVMALSSSYKMKIDGASSLRHTRADGQSTPPARSI